MSKIGENKFYRSYTLQNLNDDINVKFKSDFKIPRLIYETSVLNPKIVKRTDDWSFLHNGPSSSVSGGFSFLGKALRGSASYGRSKERDYVFNKLRELGCPDNVAMALTIQAGAESGYNPQARNSIGAGGLGGWIKGYNIQSDVLKHINSTNKKQYSSIFQASLDEQIEALKWFYYDNNKALVDAADDKAFLLSKLGFSPAITKTGSATWNGKKYTDTPEGWTQYMNDTGNNPNGKWATFEDQYLKRVKNAGFEYI